MKKSVLMMAAMMLMAGGLANAQEPEKKETPKQETLSPAPEQKPEQKPEQEPTAPEEKPEPVKPEQAPAEPQPEPAK